MELTKRYKDVIVFPYSNVLSEECMQPLIIMEPELKKWKLPITKSADKTKAKMEKTSKGTTVDYLRMINEQQTSSL